MSRRESRCGVRVWFDPYLTIVVDRYETSAGVGGFRAAVDGSPGYVIPFRTVEPTIRESLLAIIEHLENPENRAAAEAESERAWSYEHAVMKEHDLDA